MRLKLHLILLNLLKINKIFLLMFIDIIICIFSIWFSMYLRLDFLYPILNIPKVFLLTSSILLLIIFLFLDIYKTMNRYSGWDSFIQLGKALFIYNLIFFTLYTIVSFENIPRSIGVLHPLILTLIIIFFRVLIRILFSINFKPISNENILIYGAGEAGRQLATIVNFSKKMKIIKFINYNAQFIGKRINNKLVYNSKEINLLKNKFKISTILLAMPSLSNEKKSVIINNIQQNRLAVKTLPTLAELESRNISLSDLRPLNIDELLGRHKVDTSDKKQSYYIYDKIILITGEG